MKRHVGLLRTVTLLGVGALCAPRAGLAQEGWFVKLGSGFSFARDANIGSPSMRSLGYEADNIGRTLAMTGAVGRTITPNLAVDLGVSYHPDFGIDETFTAVSVKAEIQSVNALASVLYGFKPGTAVQPYVGAGVGLARNEVFDVVNIARTGAAAGLAVVDCRWAETYQPCAGDVAYSFAWQAMAGVDFRVADGLFLDVSYRYRDLGNIKLKKTSNGHLPQGQLMAHEPVISLKYTLR